VQRAAVVLLSLGEQQAAEVLKHMTAKEVQKLGVAMTSVGGISRDTVVRVFDEFVDVLAEPTAWAQVPTTMSARCWCRRSARSAPAV
jgi:flagellar motor switch protein FliG